MTDPQVALMMLGIFIILVFLGFPIAFTLMALGIGFGYYAYFDAGRQWRAFERLDETAGSFESWATWFEGFLNNRIFDLFINQTYTVMSNEVLTAVPLFLFMGYVVERANIVDKLFSTLNIAAKNIPGSMGVAALITCALFATATGIVGAVVTLMGLLALPAMLKARYNPSFASGIICAGGTLGILIPPSIMLIVYAASSGVSIVRLYAGALLPGLTLVGLYLVYVIGRSILQPSIAPKPTKEEVPDVPILQLVWMLVTSFFPLAFLILAVLGSILFGLATPTEAASIGALGGMLLAIAYRAMTFGRLRESVYLTVRTTAMVCWLFVGSYTFSAVFSYLGGEHIISEFVQGLDLRADLPAAPAALRDRPAVLRHPRGAEPADELPDATDGDVGLLPEGHRTAGGAADHDLQGRDAVPVHGLHQHGAGLQLPRPRLQPAGSDVWTLGARRHSPAGSPG